MKETKTESRRITEQLTTYFDGKPYVSTAVCYAVEEQLILARTENEILREALNTAEAWRAQMNAFKNHEVEEPLPIAVQFELLKRKSKRQNRLIGVLAVLFHECVEDIVRAYEETNDPETGQLLERLRGLLGDKK